MIDQTTTGTPSRADVDFSSNVNMTIDSTKLLIITSGCFSDTFSNSVWCRDLPPMTTGSSGNMHGANTVSTPAINDATNSSIKAIARVRLR